MERAVNVLRCACVLGGLRSRSGGLSTEKLPSFPVLCRSAPAQQLGGQPNTRCVSLFSSETGNHAVLGEGTAGQGPSSA